MQPSYLLFAISLLIILAVEWKLLALLTRMTVERRFPMAAFFMVACLPAAFVGLIPPSLGGTPDWTAILSFALTIGLATAFTILAGVRLVRRGATAARDPSTKG